MPKEIEVIWGVWPNGQEEHAFVEDPKGVFSPLCDVVIAVGEIDTEPVVNRCQECVSALRQQGIES